ncbi:hypothetical protein [Streptomyces qinzhouensis]|uniref:Transcriptional regulator n=1 Tax=Streptomyces qinzhouensis TaxID=2599401 RepID=A0A5B8JI73_9ACTN|nr:hypothetical protein [Streptomyces qinzhouensis]QDY77490.1 hypothetical protein FQU76_14220 [Streptomyces qinzhouensis]
MQHSGSGVFADLRTAAGYTQAGLVKALHTEAARLGIKATVNVRQVRRWERDSPPPLPHPSQQRVLEVLFGRPLAEMGFAVPPHRTTIHNVIGDDGEVKRRTFVSRTGAVAAATILPEQRGSRIGADAVAVLRRRLTSLYTVDHSAGGIPAQARAGRLEQHITEILNEGVYTTGIGRDLQTLRCEVTCHRAWFGYDGGPSQAAPARAACLEAIAAAQLVDNPLLQVRALNTMALLAADTGRAWEAVSAVENAYALARHSGAGATVHLVISLREANAATTSGDLTGARRALHRGVSFLSRAAADDDVPHWARFAGPVEVDYATASYYTAEGNPQRAIPFLKAAVSGLGGGYLRNTAWYRARLARTLLDAGEVDEACHEMSGVLNNCGTIASDRLSERLRAFGTATHKYDHPSAREVADRIKEATAA